MNIMTKQQAINGMPGAYSVSSNTNGYGVLGKSPSIDFKAVALLIFIGVCVIGMGVAYYKYVINKELDICDPRRKPNAHFMSLLDDTDRLNEVVIEAFRDRLMAYAGRMKTGDWLTIMTISPHDGKVIKPYLQLCKPKSGDEVNVWTENGEIIDAGYTKNYVEVLGQALEVLRDYADTESANSSPLVRALYEISKIEKFSPEIPIREILIVSDMIEHSDICSFFKNGCNLVNINDNFYIKAVMTKLASAKLDIVQLENKHAHIQKKAAFKEFWTNYFMFAGVNLKDINKSDMIVKPDSGRIKVGQWVVQIAAYQSHRKAESLKNSLMTSGFSSYHKQKDKLYVVFVGPEKCKRAAKLARDLIQRQHNIDGQVISF